MTDKKLKIIYIQPRSCGDILMSTALISRLKVKYPNSEIHYAVGADFKDLIQDHPFIDKRLEYTPEMDDINFLREYYDLVFAPHLYLQYQSSTWTHKGHTDKNLIDHMAWHCDLYEDERKSYSTKEFYVAGDPFDEFEPEQGKKYIVIVTNDMHSMVSKRYKWWQEVVDNMRNALDMTKYEFIQCGTEDTLLEGDNIIDFRSRTTLLQFNYIISRASLVLGVDSYASHLSAVLKKPQVILFGSTDPKLSGPFYIKDGVTPMWLKGVAEGCEFSCYKNECKGKSCINEIPSEHVFENAVKQLKADIGDYKFERKYPTISGYTTIYNGIDAQLPFIESIKSMVGFCDEVVVVDGESTDGTYELLQKHFGDDPKVNLWQNEWDWNTPGMDGEQKAFSRALCSSDFCWQQDGDEVVHEKDYGKIKELVRNFSLHYDILHLPVIDYFNGNNISSDYHCRKERLSRNEPNITHGIPQDAQVLDKESGTVYARVGMSDGCDYINMVDDVPISSNGFYTQELERLRQTDPKGYGEEVKRIFNELPSVRHYSWYDLPKKINQFNIFWDKMWNNLYNTEIELRFTDTVDVEVRKLISKGGCHDGGIIIPIEFEHPEVMKDWIDK